MPRKRRRGNTRTLNLHNDIEDSEISYATIYEKVKKSNRQNYRKQ